MMMMMMMMMMMLMIMKSSWDGNGLKSDKVQWLQCRQCTTTSNDNNISQNNEDVNTKNHDWPGGDGFRGHRIQNHFHIAANNDAST